MKYSIKKFKEFKISEQHIESTWLINLYKCIYNYTYYTSRDLVNPDSFLIAHVYTIEYSLSVSNLKYAVCCFNSLCKYSKYVDYATKAGKY